MKGNPFRNLFRWLSGADEYSLWREIAKPESKATPEVRREIVIKILKRLDRDDEELKRSLEKYQAAIAKDVVLSLDEFKSAEVEADHLEKRRQAEREILQNLLERMERECRQIGQVRKDEP